MSTGVGHGFRHVERLVGDDERTAAHRGKRWHVMGVGCSFPECERHPSKGDTILRVSAKGADFVGRCEEHYGEDGAAEARAAENAAQRALETGQVIQDERGCLSCGEEMPRGECPKSKRGCGHHCDCSWTFDACCWCGAEFGEDG